MIPNILCFSLRIKVALTWPYISRLSRLFGGSLHCLRFFQGNIQNPATNNIQTGKAARQNQATATTHVSPVNAHQQDRNNNYANNNKHYGASDPNVMAHQAYQQPHGDAYSAPDGNAQNRGAQAGHAAAHAAEQKQKVGKKVDQDELARIVAEENESKGKLPRYPGLERWKLVEKMGDGAFSNVYRAHDLEGNAGEVAIKVVRKFEMNSQQVSMGEIAHTFLVLRIM